MKKHTGKQWKELSEKIDASEWSKTYNEVMKDNVHFKNGKWKHPKDVRLNKRHKMALDMSLEDGRGLMALEVGCMQGYFVKALLDKSYNAYGADITKEAIEFGNQYLRDGEIGRLIYEPIESIGWMDNTFDYIYCFEVLEHIVDYKKGIRELLRVTKPGGKIFITVPYKNMIPSPYHLHSFDQHWLVGFAKHCSYITVTPHGDWMMSVLVKKE